jgi:glucose/arabinose dehydrogenase
MFLQFIYLFCFLIINLQKIYTKNITFIPKPIRITISDLPSPYATKSADRRPKISRVPINPRLFVPDGFTIKLLMTGLISPRYLIYTPTDDILVSEPNADRISCLVDTNNDGYPDRRKTFADNSNGLNQPYGMAFANGYFYVGNADAIRRYSWIRGSRRIAGQGQIIFDLDDAGHWTRTIVIPFTTDRIFISIGSASNIDIEDLPRASIQQCNLDGTNQSTFAYGLRNPIGLAFHPITNDLYVTCQERDLIGDDLVPDYFTRVKQNEFYGWPYAYLNSKLTDPRRRLKNGTSERPDLVLRTKTPDVLFQAHSGVLDMCFYTGKKFPNRYKNGAFAAFHGSWNKHQGTGYKIIFIPFNNKTNRPMGYYEDFIYGFLINPLGPNTFGRPVGLLILNDGSLIFTEDGNNRIYHVEYQKISLNT